MSDWEEDENESVPQPTSAKWTPTGNISFGVRNSNKIGAFCENVGDNYRSGGRGEGKSRGNDGRSFSQTNERGPDGRRQFGSDRANSPVTITVENGLVGRIIGMI